MTHEHHDTCLCDNLPVEPATHEQHEAIDDARRGLPLSRRSIMVGLGAVAASTSIPLASAQAAGRDHQRPTQSGRMKLVLLGTRAGPPAVKGQRGTASALVVNGKTYVINAGRAAVIQFEEAGLRFDTIAGVFLTHLHADHIADYYNFFLLGGHIPNPDGDRITRPVPIYGPGQAGGLPPKFGGGTAPTIAPEAPTPGTLLLTENLHRAYAYSSNVFLRDMNIPDIRQLMDVREITTPAGATFENTCPDMAPVEIFDDGNVKVSAVLVPHGPMFPSYAYRFDTEYGSVTFSGDTTYSKNLIGMAHRTDILVHECVDLTGATLNPADRDHMLQSHVELQKMGAIAEAAEAKKLVVSHYVKFTPGPINFGTFRRDAQIGYTRGRAVIGRELDVFEIGGRRRS